MKQVRSKKGSMLFLMVCLIAVLYVPALILMVRLGPWIVFNQRAEDSIQAASKLAAIDLSRIVMKDPAFGFISLSNHEPIGTLTRADDGEPLPVTSINTLVGALRFSALLGEELNNSTIRDLVDRDADSLSVTTTSLNQTLEASLCKETQWNDFKDIEGKTVNPVADVDKFLSDNLPPQLKLKSYKLSLGWLDGASETLIPVPQPVALAKLKSEKIIDGKYEAFTSYPVAGHDYQFAGLGSRPHLVPTSQFREPDGKHICSIVRLECIMISDEGAQTETKLVACAQAYSNPEKTILGSMTLRFPGRPVPGLMAWSEFLNSKNFHDNKTTTFDIVGGDFPFEQGSRMKASEPDIEVGTAQQFANHLYCWLKSSHVCSRLDSVLAMIYEPFCRELNTVYIYEFSPDGSITRNNVSGNQFTRPVVADGQFASMIDTKLTNGPNAIILFRDSVMKTDTESGKHGGQPLAGYPLTNSERSYTDHKQIAENFCKRSQFKNGLALDIEIGGTGDTNARQDIAMMRMRTRLRRI